MRLKLPLFNFRQGKYKLTVILFSTRIFTETKCQVSLVIQYVKVKIARTTILATLHFLSVTMMTTRYSVE